MAPKSIIRPYALLLLCQVTLVVHTQPCYVQSARNSNELTDLIYPNCNDSSTYFCRKFQDGILISEMWVKNNLPAGIENHYAEDNTNLLTSSFYWGRIPSQTSVSYYPGTNRLKEVRQQIQDTIHFNMSFYFNGRVRSFGLSNDSNCNFGTWTELDSLSRIKHVGNYKLVRKEEREHFTEGILIIQSCFEKDGWWIKTDNHNAILEKTFYLEGKPKHGH